jgi:septal ring factor EnvC (AmiA/AmiB activator)
MTAPAAGANLRAMTTSPDQPAAGPAAPRDADAAASSRHGRPWGWIGACVLLVLVAGGLMIWALGLNSDLDDQKQQTAAAQQQAQQANDQLDSISQQVDDISQTVSDASDQLAQAGSDAQQNAQQALDGIKTKLESAQDQVRQAIENFRASNGGGSP